jgi:hypothetical protein
MKRDPRYKASDPFGNRAYIDVRVWVIGMKIDFEDCLIAVCNQQAVEVDPVFRHVIQKAQ